MSRSISLRRFPKASAICAIALGTATAHAGIVNRWSFNNTTGSAPAGTTMADSISGAVATVRGNYSTFTGAAVKLQGPPGNPTQTTNGQQTGAAISGYIDLPNGIISSKTNLSLEIWATPHSARAWMRLFDIGRTADATGFGPGAAPGEIIDVAGSAPGWMAASDNLMQTLSMGPDLNWQRSEMAVNGGSYATLDTNLATAANTEHHYVVTFQDGVGTYGSSGGQMKCYRDGALLGTRDVAFHLSALEDVNNWLGRSNWTADDNAHASYNEFRIYNHALTQAEVSADFNAGPNTLPSGLTTPAHLWTFTTPAQLEATPDTTFTDSVGSQIATLRGNGASLTGGAVTLPGSTTGNETAATISAYLDLPNGIISQTASVTVEAWASPLSSKNWQRLFDFGRCANSYGEGAAPGEIRDGAAAPGGYVAYDNLGVTLNNGENINSQQLEGQIDGNPAQFTFTNANTVAGTKYHYVMVVENTAGGCQARWYRNNVLQNTANYGFHLYEIEDVNNWIGRSMYGGDSNSHLTLDELRIYRRAITPAEITTSYNAGPDPAMGAAEPPVAAPIPSRRWNFNNAAGAAPSGTQFLDTATGEVATIRGNGATTNGTELVLTGTTDGNQTAANISGYLDMPDGMISSRPNLTLEAWVTPLSSKNWQRLFDFGSTSLTSGAGADPGEIIDGPTAPGAFVANDNLFLSLNTGGALGAQRLEGKLTSTAAVTSNGDYSSGTFAGTKYHYVMSVQDATGSFGSTGCRVKWYRNGGFAGSIDLPFRLPDLHDVNNWIGRSMWAGDSNANFKLDELRLYDRAITWAEVNSSYAAGAAAVFPSPVAADDQATVYIGQKVLVDVLANDTGSPAAATLQIVSPPAIGTAAIANGKILYTHVGTATTPVTFTYRVGNVSGNTSQATVTITVSDSLRIANPGLAMPTAPPATAFQAVDAVSGVSFNQPICIATIPGDSNRLFVGERMAKIQLVPDVTATTPTKTTFLDLQQVIANRVPAESINDWWLAESGLLGVVFHPNYASNGYFYVTYTVQINGGAYYERLSRFKVSAGNPNVADATSELILLQQLDEGLNHQGGDMHFGPDGYLYYAAGDEENGYDFRVNSQNISKDFFAGIFRIDVDKKPGNLAPNPHAAIPTDSGVARFSVPIDNPFVHTSLGGTWNGTYNGNTVSPLSGVRTEFWATGLRHVWRMSFDSETGDLWAGDVGQDLYEEINLIQKGGNYGWVYREGAHDTNFTNPVPPTKPAGFTSIDPAYEYVHTSVAGGDAQFKGNSVVGGIVYRGTRFPALYGFYIFCDSVSGHIWKRDPATGVVSRITGVPGVYGGLSSMGVDPSNKDVLFADYLNGKILRLGTGSGGSTFPATLSATGLFADLTDLSPSPGLLSYEPNLTFWSDHAVKRRWFGIPQANDTMTWSLNDSWSFPTGMVTVKHFDLELTRGNPATKKRLETRVLVKTDTGTYGVSYRWNDAQTDATLVPDEGVEFNIEVSENGLPHTQRWQIPGRSSCLTCHTPQAGHVLSFSSRQLNRTYTVNGVTGNQLTLLHDAGYLSNDPGPPNLLPRHVKPDEAGYTLEDRTRSYLAVNCAYCHHEGGTVAGANWDGSAHLTLEETGLINGEAENNGGNPLNKYIVPGDLDHSIVRNRMAVKNGFTRMPPLGSSELDQVDISLVEAWILQGSSNGNVQLAFDDGAGTVAADSSGNGRNGTLVNGATWTTGAYGGAVALDGADDHVSFQSGVVAGLSNFTISMWVNPDVLGTWTRLFDFGNSTNNYMFLTPSAFGTNKPRYGITKTGGVGEQMIESSVALTPGVWSHIAVSLSGNVGTLYVNGVAVGSNPAMTLKPSDLGATGRNWLGKSQYPDPTFDGRIDEFRIYNSALSGSQIQALAVPAAPTGLLATAVSDNRINLSWTAPAAATSYNVKRSSTIGGPYATVATGIVPTNYSDSGLAGSTTYYYVVSAANASGEGVNSTSSSATTLPPPPAPWVSADIGAVGVMGSATHNSGTYTLSGSGADIWGAADAFRYVSQTLTGNGEIRARVTSIGNSDPWAKAGVMIRDGSGAGATNAMMTVTPSSGFSFQWRTTASGGSNFSQGPATNPVPNNWVRLVRSGNLLTGYYSADGVTWTQQGTTTVTMGSSVSVGLAVTSHNNTVANTATFDNVSITPYPSPWLTADIGTTGLVGSAEYFGGAHTVKGAGTFGGTVDGYRYVYQTLSADGAIVARIKTLNNTGANARVCIMMRDTLANNSRMAALSVDGLGAYKWERRTTAGGAVSNTNSTPNVTAPNIWVRLTRVGNNVTAAKSTDGTNWTNISTVAVTMASNCYIGIGVASGSTSTLNTSVFDNITVTP